MIYPVFPANIHGFETGFVIHSVGHMFAIMANLISLIETAVPVRFPELKVTADGGRDQLGAIPPATASTRSTWSAAPEVPLLEERPSTYLKRFY